MFSTSGTNLFSYVIAQPDFLEGSDFLLPDNTTQCHDSNGRASGSSVDLNSVQDSIHNLQNGYKSNSYMQLNPVQCQSYHVTSEEPQ